MGLSKQEVREREMLDECDEARFRETSRGQIMGMDYGVLKIICERNSRKVLGVHIIGEGASELIHIRQAVINLGGSVDYFVDIPKAGQRLQDRCPRRVEPAVVPSGRRGRVAWRPAGMGYRQLGRGCMA